MRERGAQAPKKVAKGKSRYNRSCQVERPRMRAGQQESSPFPLDHARRKKGYHEKKGQRLETKAGVSGTLGSRGCF